MCGILGVRDDVLSRLGGSFAGAVAAMEWRGRDGTRSLQAGGWRLAVARLTISDPSAPQPLVCPRSGRVALCNGAFTSAAAERRELGAAEFATGNDAELPLVRLRLHGRPIGPRTCGHYALAVVDPARGELWLARDAMGEKPLFAVQDRGGRVLAFASTPASLQRLGFALDFADGELATFLRYGFAPRPRLRDPGLSLRDDLAGTFVATGDGPLRPVPAADSGWDAATPLRARVEAAVARCIDTEQPVALALSGGVDSSALALAVAPADRAWVTAYSVQARGADGAERTAARTAAAAAGIALRCVDIGSEVLRALPELVAAAGLPLGDPSLLAVHALARAVRGDGHRVLLSGEGADELFLGYRRQRAARWLPARGLGGLPSPDPMAMSASARLRRALAAERPYDELLAVAPPGFAAEALVPELQRPPGLAQPEPSGTALQRAAQIDREVYLRRDLLPKLDVAALAAGVEGRSPYLDPEVRAAPEAGDARPAGLGKRALRRAFPDLPAPTRRLRKTGFALPLDDWLRRDDSVADLLLERRALERPHLRRGGVVRLLDAHRRGSVRVGHGLFLLAALECHLRAVEDVQPCGA